MNRITRRKFIGSAAVFGGGFYYSVKESFSGKLSSLSDTVFRLGKSKVIKIHTDTVRTGSAGYDNTVLVNMLNAGICELLDTENPVQAWNRIVSRTSRVGLKVNCLAGKRMSTNAALVDALIHCLAGAGVPRNNIYVWDRFDSDLKRAGFMPGNSANGVKYIGNDHSGYADNLFTFGKAGSQVSRTATDICDVLINLPVLKDHGIVGVSCALKNYFGAIHNPNKYHLDAGNPYVADVNMFPPLRGKTRLTVCDALLAQYEGGPPYKPQWTWKENSIFMAQDMVALDKIAWDVIEKKRKEHNRPALKEAGKEPQYIATAADGDHNLGTDDMNLIQYCEISL